MMPDTYTFTGDGVTFLGLIGVFSTAIIIVTAFRRYYNSPMNVSLKGRQSVPPAEVSTEPPQGI